MMVPVLMYHHISPLAGPHTVTPDLFRDHLQMLSDRGIRTLSLDEFASWRCGELSLQQPSVLLTFDDAWLDNWVFALPVLQEFQAKAAFFVVTSWPGDGEARLDLQENNAWQPPSHARAMQLGGTADGDRVSMRWSELLAAADTRLISLASHSHGHGDWWRQQAGDVLEGFEADLEQTRRVMQEKTGTCPPHFCWPKGHFSYSMIGMAKRYGFVNQYSTLRGSNQPRAARLVRRINVENRSAEWLRRHLEIYRNALIASVLGIVHQNLQYERLRKRYPYIPHSEFTGPRFALL